MTASDWAFTAYILIGLVLFLGAIIFVLEGNVTRLAADNKRLRDAHHAEQTKREAVEKLLRDQIAVTADLRNVLPMRGRR